MRQIATRLLPFLAAVIVAAVFAHGRAPESQALFHFSHISEVGLDASGSPQYVEIKLDADLQDQITNARLTAFSADGSTFTVLKLYTTNLPSTSTNGKTFITASSSFATVVPLVNPDYVFDGAGTIPAVGQICWGAPGVLPPVNPNSWSAGDIANYIDCVAYGGTNAFNIKYPPRTTLPPGDGMLSLTRSSVMAMHNNSLEYTLACPTPSNFAGVPPTGLFGACTAPPDGDGDTVPDFMDNCPAVSNMSQTNTDNGRLGVGMPQPDRTNPHGDLLGDVCDTVDSDNDGLSDSLDPNDANVDSDGDVWTDNAEYLLSSDPLNVNEHACMAPSVCTDADGDFVPDDIDPNDANVDSDGDGVRDGTEFRFRATSMMSTDSDGDGCGDRGEILGIDGNSNIGFADLLQFASSYNARGPAHTMGTFGAWDANKDFDGNSIVAFSDLLLFAQAYNLLCPPMVGIAP